MSAARVIIIFNLSGITGVAWGCTVMIITTVPIIIAVGILFGTQLYYFSSVALVSNVKKRGGSEWKENAGVWKENEGSEWKEK